VNLRPITTRHRQRRPSVRPGQVSGVAVVARPTASKGWRREPEHGRRRPAAGVTTPEQQRLVRQEEATTKHDHSRRRYVQDVRPTTSPSHSRLDGDSRGRQYDNSSVQQLRLTLVTQRQHTRTAVRQLVQFSNSSVTLRRAYTPTTSTSTTVATVVRHRNSSATRAQFQSHCVSDIHVNRLTELL